VGRQGKSERWPTTRGSVGLGTAERDELLRLRRENKQLRLERDILSKAAAWLARETGTLPVVTTQHACILV
jgi:transposase